MFWFFFSRAYSITYKLIFYRRLILWEHFIQCLRHSSEKCATSKGKNLPGKTLGGNPDKKIPGYYGKIVEGQC